MLDLTAWELRDRFTQGGDATVLSEHLNSIARHDGKIRAFLHFEEAEVRRQIQDLEAKRRRGESLGALAGVPVAIKDALCVTGQTTTCGSKMLIKYRPPFDAHVITKLKQADAILIGKTNLDEFAMGSSTENSAFQTTRNPWDPQCTPGGSSGGSAAAVAAGFAPLALGSDTGGSIRQPAALCGLVGLKPTYGRVSRFGLVAYGSSLDQIGPFARDARDAALLLEVIAGHDSRDSTSAVHPVPTYTKTIAQPVLPLTIGVAWEYFTRGLDPEVESAVRAALKVYQDLGATLVDVSLPHGRFGVAAYYLIATAEASSNLARYDGVHFGHRAANFVNWGDMMARSRGEGFGPEVKRRIMLGTHALSTGYVEAYYLKALKVRRLIRNDFSQAFAHCDVIMGPTTPTPAFKLGEKVDNPLAMYLSDIYTISANLAGLPALSVPCGFSAKGLPIGLQILGEPFAEEKLLRVAYMHEQATAWHRRRPPAMI